MIFKTLFSLLSLTSALPWDGAQPTSTIQLGSVELFKRQHEGFPPVLGMNPAPTVAPRHFIEGNDFWKRQASSVFGTTTNNTCGFLNGATAVPYTCNGGAKCAIATSQNVHACCSTLSACNLVTACIASSQLASCAADTACLSATSVVKCGAAYPYCNQLILIGEGNQPATDWFCDTAPFIGTIFATAIDGGKSSASFAFVTLNISPSASKLSSSSSTISSSFRITTSSSSFQISSSIRISSTSTTSTTTTSSSAAAAETGTSGSPIGAIVGGSVGGVAVLAAIAFGIFFILHNKNKKPKPSPPIIIMPENDMAGPSTQPKKETFVPYQPPFIVSQNTSSPVSQGPAYSPTMNQEQYRQHSASPMSAAQSSPPLPQYQPQNPSTYGISEADGRYVGARTRPGDY